MSRFSRLRRGGAPVAAERFSLDDLAAQLSAFTFGGHRYDGGLSTTWTNEKAEPIGSDFAGYVQSGYQSNGVVFACILARLLLFTEARFQWQRLEKGRPGGLYPTPELAILETPWPNGTTGDLLARMEQDASLGGNAYIARRGDRLKRMRPDWVGIVVGSPSGDPDDLDAEPVGYVYYPGGPVKCKNPVILMPSEVAHYAPIPDPGAHYRGMSWLSPVIDELRADGAATRHKLKFFENAATPNLMVSVGGASTPEQMREFVSIMEEDHDGLRNAYKTLYLAAGSDAKVIGANLKQLDFKVTQGAGETRICAAAGVPPIIVGLSEGLEASTYSNYGMARRKFGDHWARPSWRQAAAALASIVPAPGGARLWYDDRDIAFLQEDQADAASILMTDAQSVRQLTDGGYTPESVVAAVAARNLSLLQHTGLLPVQMQPPGAGSQPSA